MALSAEQADAVIGGAWFTGYFDEVEHHTDAVTLQSFDGGSSGSKISCPKSPVRTTSTPPSSRE